MADTDSFDRDVRGLIEDAQRWQRLGIIGLAGAVLTSLSLLIINGVSGLPQAFESFAGLFLAGSAIFMTCSGLAFLVLSRRAQATANAAMKGQVQR